MQRFIHIYTPNEKKKCVLTIVHIILVNLSSGTWVISSLLTLIGLCLLSLTMFEALMNKNTNK